MQASSFTTDAAGGFRDAHVALLTGLAPSLGAAFEPIAMRRSAASLLTTYLGRGPAREVQGAAIGRGDRRSIEAAILLADLRGSTAYQEELGEAALLTLLDRYFATVVDAVQERGGDVLKFIGDGVLAIFPAATSGPAGACAAALEAAVTVRAAVAAAGEARVALALHLGTVTYGNIGSPDRLDFTVVGGAINLASRLEALAKEVGRTIVAPDTFAAEVTGRMERLGAFELRGFARPRDVYAAAEH